MYKSFPLLSNALAGLGVKNAILDGEIVCLDKFGRSQFLELMRRRRQDTVFYAFDIQRRGNPPTPINRGSGVPVGKTRDCSRNSGVC